MQELLKKLYGDVVTEESLATFHEELGKRFVSKADFNRRGEELKQMREQTARMEAEQSAALAAGEEAKRLELALEAEKKRHAEELDAMLRQERQAAMDRELAAAGARNLTAVKALLDMDKITFADGQLSGLAEQLWELKKDNNFLFEEKEQMIQFIHPAAVSQSEMSREDFQKMGYMERLKMKREQPELYQMMKQK